MTGRPGILTVALNVAFGLSLSDSAEAREWLHDGGWELFDRWIATRPTETNAITKETHR